MRTFNRELFPAPEGPIIAVTLEWGNFPLTFLRIGVPSWRVKPRESNSMVILGLMVLKALKP